MSVARSVTATLVSTGSSSWQAPIGVPTPTFGINQTAPAQPSPWTSTVSGWYYVCPSCAGATNTSNTNGYPTKPRTSIPSTLAAGSVVILAGSTISGNQSFTANGTAASPIFVRGVDYASRPKLTAGQLVTGSYVILENIHWGAANASSTDFGVGAQEGSDHIVFRNCETSGNLNRAGGIGLGSWGYSGTQSLSHVVVNNCHLHDIGDVNSSLDQDAHCIVVNGSVDNLWVTYNTIERCSGDAIQIEAQAGRRPKIHHVYYGKNHSSFNRQSGGGIKHATDIIFSQNRLHDFEANSGGPGPCIAFQYGPEQVWLLYNELYNCAIGIAMLGNNGPGDGLFQYAIGNRIYDIQADPSYNTYNQGGFVIYGGTNVTLVNNTIDNATSGINIMPGVSSVTLVNNIVSNRTLSGQHHHDIYWETLASLGTVSNNLFYNAGGTRFVWDGVSRTTVPSQCQDCGVGNPMYVDLANADYHLQASSPAVNTGTVSSVYATFQARYGLSIAVDADGNARPAGAAWDIGAFEH